MTALTSSAYSFIRCSKQIVAQQFELGKRIMEKGLIPILEPEVNINSPDKGECEAMLLAEIIENVSTLSHCYD